MSAYPHKADLKLAIATFSQILSAAGVTADTD
jgi:hypothetical protein